MTHSYEAEARELLRSFVARIRARLASSPNDWNLLEDWERDLYTEWNKKYAN